MPDGSAFHFASLTLNPFLEEGRSKLMSCLFDSAILISFLPIDMRFFNTKDREILTELGFLDFCGDGYKLAKEPEKNIYKRSATLATYVESLLKDRDPDSVFSIFAKDRAQEREVRAVCKLHCFMILSRDLEYIDVYNQLAANREAVFCAVKENSTGPKPAI